METVINERMKQFEKQKKNLRKTLTDETEGLITEERISIIEKSPEALLAELRDGLVSAVDVLKAFQAKALEVTERINCVTEFIPEAESWAERLDGLKSNERGPLHGIPISIKESVDVMGCDSTLGLAQHVYCPVAAHSPIVHVLLNKGAVPFCKTNIPQAVLSFCCSNPVFGTTLHPKDDTRTPGGSSGGESALIAEGGSILGIGSDLAGSARVPASFCGCVGIKPTLNRLSSKGIRRGLPGMVGNVSVPGVMGRDTWIVTKCMQVLLAENDLVRRDIEVVPLPWNEAIANDQKPLTIGWYDSMDLVPSTPGVRRAAHIARDALARRGHKLIPFCPPDCDKVIAAIVKVLTADCGRTMTEHLKGETVHPNLIPAMKAFTYTNAMKKYIKYRLAPISKTLPLMLQTDIRNCYDLWKELTLRENYIKRLSSLMREKEIDVLVGPNYPVPAPQHHIPALIGPACIYTCLYNYCDFPAISVPITRENEDDQIKLQQYPEDDLLFRILKKASTGATGLPLGAQVIGYPWQEEMVCRVANELEMEMKKERTEVIQRKNV